MAYTRTHHILAVGAATSVLVAFFALLFVPVPEENRDAVNLILGALITVGFGQVMSFFFGSTQGSNQKTEAAANAAAATAGLVQQLAKSTGNGSPDTVHLAPGDAVKVEADSDDPAMYGGPRA